MAAGVLISVIMPCYNAADHVRTSVQSALSQTYPNIELIAVDDGSADATLDVLRQINDSRLKIFSQSNLGVCVARNRGIQESQGDLIAFLDADDTWARDCLENLVAPLVKDEEAVLAYCGWQNVGIPGPRGEPFVPPDYENSKKIELLLEGCRWPIHAALTRRAAIIEAGGFDERFRTSEDYYLWLRIATRKKIVRVPEVLAYYHHHSLQTTNNRIQVACNRMRVKKEFLAQNPQIRCELGRRKLRRLQLEPLLKTGYQCYWDRDLIPARALFRMVMKAGYGSLSDWKYMLPSLLPLSLHEKLIRMLKNREVTMS